MNETLVNIFKDYIAYVGDEYQKILNLLKRRDIELKEEDFFDLIENARSSSPTNFSAKCEILIRDKKANYGALDFIRTQNQILKGTPDFDNYPFVSLIDGKVFKFKNSDNLVNIAKESQKKMKTEYMIMLDEFIKKNEIEELRLFSKVVRRGKSF